MHLLIFGCSVCEASLINVSIDYFLCPHLNLGVKHLIKTNPFKASYKISCLFAKCGCQTVVVFGMCSRFCGHFSGSWLSTWYLVKYLVKYSALAVVESVSWLLIKAVSSS